MSLTPWRFFYIYVVLAGITVYFIYIGTKVLRRDPDFRLNQIFTGFYYFVALGLIINMIYAAISIPAQVELVIFLNKLTMYLATSAMAFMLLFIIMVYNPNLFQKTYQQLLFISIYFFLEAGIFFIPNGVIVTIHNDGTQSYPKWNLLFALYLLIVLLISSTLSIIFMLKVRKRFRNDILKRKFKFFIIGISTFYYFGIMATISNYFDMTLIRNIYTATSFFVVVGGVFLYRGIGLDLDENFEF